MSVYGLESVEDQDSGDKASKISLRAVKLQELFGSHCEPSRHKDGSKRECLEKGDQCGR